MANATIGKAIDEIRRLELRAEGYARKIAVIEKEISKKKARLQLRFKQDDLNGATGKLGRCEVKPRDVPAIDDFDTLVRHAAKRGEFDLLQKRVSIAAVRERWEAGKKVPGVRKQSVTTLRVYPLKR